VSILRGINGNVTFIVIYFFYLNIHRIFLSHLLYRGSKFQVSNSFDPLPLRSQ